MPELPEVEVTRMGIAPHVEGRTIERMVVRQPQLRWRIEPVLIKHLKNAQIMQTARRGKYLALFCACADGVRGVLLIHLGMEPFDANFDGAYIYRVTRSIKQAIKVSLLSGKWVVGVGNIYASEVLFLCGIHPEKPACALTRAECRKLAQHVPQLLQSAIERGGSTLKDFVNSDGNTGYFQMNFNVYDRSGESCVRCKTPIMRIVQAQRATYFCAQCQK